jgi:hypothetical protein
MAEGSTVKMNAEHAREFANVHGTVSSNPGPTLISKRATCTVFPVQHCGNALRC